jgi:hypothetical protein
MEAILSILTLLFCVKKLFFEKELTQGKVPRVLNHKLYKNAYLEKIPLVVGRS